MNYETAKRLLDKASIVESSAATIYNKRYTYLGLYVDERGNAQAVLRPWQGSSLEMRHPSWLITNLSVWEEYCSELREDGK